MRSKRLSRLTLWLVLTALVPACGDDDGGGGGNENEVITTVTLTFVPTGGGSTVTAVFNDPDGDGGAAPTIDAINLAAGRNYTMSVKLENRLETPPEDITEEIVDEADEHQLFFTGTAVNGPASNQAGAPLAHLYSDEDDDGLPIGLENSVVTTSGTGQLTVTLRHVPPVNGAPAKVANLASQVRTGGFSAIGGSTDVQVTFMVTAAPSS